MDVVIEAKTIVIKGLVVGKICSPIHMINPALNKNLKEFPLTMDFGKSNSAKFHIDVLIGLDMMVKLLPAAALEGVQVKKVEDILLLGLGDKFLPFGSNAVEESAHETPRKKSLLNLGGPTGVKTAFLDVILQEFFKTENPESPPTALEKTMAEQMNDCYEKSFKETYTLIENQNEPGAKRFCVVPQWKPPELRSPHSPESTTKETLRRFLALEQRMSAVKNKKLREGYENSVKKNLYSGMLEKYGNFEDVKEEFLTSYLVDGNERAFKALAPTHLVIQDKAQHPIRHTIDYTSLNGLFAKGANALNAIDDKVAEMRAHHFIFGMDISKQFHQILTQNPLAQCILHRSEAGGPLEVFVHKALMMGHISSTSLAGLCMLETGRLFDELMEKARNGSLDYNQVYQSLAKALQPGAILDPKTVPKQFSLEELIKDSLYADNIIICENERDAVVIQATTTILALNSYSFKVHEVFSNLIPEMLLIVESVRAFGGHAEIHPEVERLLDEGDVSYPTLNVQRQPNVDQGKLFSPSPEQDKIRNNVCSASAVNSDPVFTSSPLCNIIINTKPFLFHKDESVSYLNPHSLLKIYGLNFAVCKQKDEHDILKFLICYDHLAKLADFDLNRVCLRKISEILGSLWEPSPYILTGLKSPVKLALHLTYKIKQVLIDHKKLLLSLLTYGKSPGGKGGDVSNEKWYRKHKDHPIYANLINLAPASVDHQMTQIKKMVPLLTWDTCLTTIRDEILDYALITNEIKEFISIAIQFIFGQLESFSNLARIMCHLKVPLNYTFDCKCQIIGTKQKPLLGLEKYLVIFTDAATSKENFLDSTSQLKFAYGFTSCLIYLVHRCQKTSELQASLLSAYNKLSAPNQDIIRCEASGPLLACKRVPYFAKLYGISPENIVFFCDNLPFLSLVRNFDKNYLTYKPFYLKTIKQIFDLGMLASKFYYVNTELNLSDLYTRPLSMDASKLDQVLGSFDKKRREVKPLV